MRQGLLLVTIAFCVACIIAFQVINRYAEKDVQSLSKTRTSEAVFENHAQDIVLIKRHQSLSNMRHHLGIYGWVLAIVALLYSLRLIGKYQLIKDKNETLRADLRERKIAEQAAVRNR